MQSILFVCLGNICRSPLAEGVAREIIKQNNLAIEVDSAGTSGWHIDEPPCEGSRAVARQHGFSIDDLRGRRLSVYADDRFDLIIALDSKNYRDILALGFAKQKVRKLGDYGLNGADVPDPYTYRDMEGFEAVYAMIERGVKNLLAELAPLRA